jgi:hypothetical protein
MKNIKGIFNKIANLMSDVSPTAAPPAVYVDE